MEMVTQMRWDYWTRRRLERRRVLQVGATGVVSLAGAAAAGACAPASTGSNVPPSAPTSAPAAAAPAATTAPVPKYGGVLVGPTELRQVFNDTDEEVLWLIVGAPEELEFLQGSKSEIDLSLIYPLDPVQLPKELAGADWPPKT